MRSGGGSSICCARCFRAAASTGSGGSRTLLWGYDGSGRIYGSGDSSDDGCYRIDVKDLVDDVTI